MDTWNDGTELTDKTVLPLAGVTHTGPWTWHGWQDSLEASVQNSFVSTMQGSQANPQDVQAVMDYLQSLRPRPSPFVSPDGSLSEQALRGQQLFRSAAFGCGDCHRGDYFTDGQVHDVGMSRETDKYQGYNTPSLLGLYRKVRFLHDGRAKSLEDVLLKWHTPQDIGGGAEPSEQQLADLIAYLKSL
jgi:cytochrome c peroxidase